MSSSSVPRSAGSVWPFLALVYGTTWLFQLPWLAASHHVLPGPPARYEGLVVLGFFGPTLLAVAVTLSEGGRAGLRDLFRPFRFLGASFRLYLLALALSPALFLIARCAWGLASENAGPWFYPPRSAAHVAAMAIIPFTEQLPWRALVYPRLAARYGEAGGSVATGLAWGLFHAQKHAFFPDTTLPATVAMVCLMTASAVVFTALQRRARGSVLVVVAANAGVYLDNPAYALPDVRPLVALTVIYVLVAAALLVALRRLRA